MSYILNRLASHKNKQNTKNQKISKQFHFKNSTIANKIDVHTAKEFLAKGKIQGSGGKGKFCDVVGE
jgi:hypothetical protein